MAVNIASNRYNLWYTKAVRGGTSHEVIVYQAGVCALRLAMRRV